MTEEFAVRGFCENCFVTADFLRHEKRNFIETKGAWSKEVHDDASIFRVANRYQSLSVSKAVKHLLLQKMPFLQDYKIDLYDIDERNDWIYVNINETSLYTPFSCLLNHDANGIIDTHFNYWHDYKHGKEDETVKTFLVSKEVKEFLEKVTQEA